MGVGGGWQAVVVFEEWMPDACPNGHRWDMPGSCLAGWDSPPWCSLMRRVWMCRSCDARLYTPCRVVTLLIPQVPMSVQYPVSSSDEVDEDAVADLYED